MVLAVTALAVLAVEIAAFVASRVTGRNDVADVAWGLGFLAAALASLAAAGIYSPRALLVTAMVALWGIRLALHIRARNRGRGEDPRYHAWREQWGRWFTLRSFLQVFLLQGVLLLVVAAPVVAVNLAPASPWGWLDAAGTAVWLTGFLLEATADRQLCLFLKDPSNRGKLLTSGLWRYSRHPNYFGEVLLWWGLWIVALSVPGGWWTVAGPLTITFLILKVSGVPMLEKLLEGRPDFEAYRRRTSAFVPLPPRKEP